MTPEANGPLADEEPADLGQVAVIGLAGRFPGGGGLAEFWAGLAEGRESLTRFAADESTGFTPAHGIVPDGDRFDTDFFGFALSEALLLDPQQRVFLECAWEALEHAGYDPKGYPGADRGVRGERRHRAPGPAAGAPRPVPRGLGTPAPARQQRGLPDHPGRLQARPAPARPSPCRPPARPRWWPCTLACTGAAGRRVRHGAGRRRLAARALPARRLPAEGGIVARRRPLPDLRRRRRGHRARRRRRRRAAQAAGGRARRRRPHPRGDPGLRGQQRRRRQGRLHRARASTGRPRSYAARPRGGRHRPGHHRLRRGARHRDPARRPDRGRAR